MTEVPAGFSEVVGEFPVPGEPVEVVAWGGGHIHDTFRALYRLSPGGGMAAFVHQRVNEEVFPDLNILMDNLARVTAHLCNGDPRPRRALELMPATDGRSYVRDSEGRAWRTFPFVPFTTTRDEASTPELAESAARAFGAFQKAVVDLPGPRLHEVIPGFHDTPSRFETFRRALAGDRQRRAADCRPEVDFALAHEDLCQVLLGPHRDGAFPERLAHNDAKLNNVLLDSDSGEAMCVVDLDTVMPALSLYDFGDLVRTASHHAAEDTTVLSEVRVDAELMAALGRGYLAEAGEFLNETERELLFDSGRLIAFETGLRFLTDHLQGDTYFKVHRPDHNLHRCRTQFALVADLEARDAELRALLKKV